MQSTIYSENNFTFFFEEPIITYARQLRQNQTKAEELMWKILRSRKFQGYKFRRQHSVSKKYIVDFFCFDKNLAIELDGRHHQEPIQKQYDRERTNFLNHLGITVIRFTNEQVLNRTDVVLKEILDTLIGDSSK